MSKIKLITHTKTLANIDVNSYKLYHAVFCMLYKNTMRSKYYIGSIELNRKIVIFFIEIMAEI